MVRVTTGRSLRAIIEDWNSTVAESPATFAANGADAPSTHAITTIRHPTVLRDMENLLRWDRSGTARSDGSIGRDQGETAGSATRQGKSRAGAAARRKSAGLL